MKKHRLIAIISVMLCFLMILPSCKLRRKGSATEPEESDETDESSEETGNASVFQMDVRSLDQFISDGSIFAENVPVPTPTPIPVAQSALGLTNDVDGYYSGPLENATIVDNEYFRFTIVSAELTADGYVLTSQFENKTDNSFSIHLKNPVLDNECTDYYFYTNTIEPHKVLDDVTNYSSVFKDHDNTKIPTRLSFLILGIPYGNTNHVVLADPVNELNYIPVNIFPQGEDAYHYEDYVPGPTSEIVYDSEGAEFLIDGFDLTDSRFRILYTFINKTSDYVRLQLDDGQITLDKNVFKPGTQSIYIPPYSRITTEFYIERKDIEEANLDPMKIKLASIPLKASTLTDKDKGIKVLWDTVIKKEVDFG